MAIAVPRRRLGFGWRVALLTVTSALAILVVNATAAWQLAFVASAIPNLTPGEAAYLAWVGNSLLTGLCLIALVAALIWLERPTSLRRFLKLGPVDWPSVGLFALFIVVLNVLERSLLRPLLFEPLRLFLVSLGLWGQSSISAGFVPDDRLLVLNLLLLLLVCWIEAPEEVFFRGYVQNHLQERIGPARALFLGAGIWSFWHLFAIADVAHVLLFGLAISLVFCLRQNTTSLAILHPLSNRLLMLAVLLPLSR